MATVVGEQALAGKRLPPEHGVAGQSAAALSGHGIGKFRPDVDDNLP